MGKKLLEGFLWQECKQYGCHFRWTTVFVYLCNFNVFRFLHCLQLCSLRYKVPELSKDIRLYAKIRPIWVGVSHDVHDGTWNSRSYFPFLMTSNHSLGNFQKHFFEKTSLYVAQRWTSVNLVLEQKPEFKIYASTVFYICLPTGAQSKAISLIAKSTAK